MSDLKPAMHGRDHCPGGADPIPCWGLQFASVITGVQSISDNAGHDNYVDFENGGGGFSLNRNDARLDLVDDTPNTPFSGISVPGGYLVQVFSAVMLNSLTADGHHHVAFAVSGAYSVEEFAPFQGLTPAGASSATGMADDWTAPDTLVHIAHIGDVQDFVVGVKHEWENWTNDPGDFRYSLSVTLIGTLPT
jgi:hypothetical protein